MNLLNGGKVDMKKTNYFSHDSNARNDDKILSVRMKFGAEGYGIYFMLLERLREDRKYMSIRDYNMIAFDFRTSVDKIKSIVEDFGLFIFTEDGKCFYSENFNERMSVKDEKAEKRSIAGRKGMASRYAKKQQNDNNVITELDNLDNNVITELEKNLTSKVKESKVKESKVKESKEKESKEKESKGELHTEEAEIIEVIEDSDYQDTFRENLLRFKKEFPSEKRYEEIAMMFSKKKDEIEMLLDEFIKENEQSRKHDNLIGYDFLTQELKKHFFNWVRAKERNKEEKASKQTNFQILANKVLKETNLNPYQ